MPHRGRRTGPEVSDGWKNDECELMDALKNGGERAEGLPCKIGEERVDGLSRKIVGKNVVEKIEVELVRNELMGFTEKEGLKDESQLHGVAQELQAGELLLGIQLS